MDTINYFLRHFLHAVVQPVFYSSGVYYMHIKCSSVSIYMKLPKIPSFTIPAAALESINIPTTPSFGLISRLFHLNSFHNLCFAVYVQSNYN